MNDALLEHVTKEFRLDPHGYHGPAHWARVRDRGLALAKLNGVSAKVVELFALLHDYQRMDEGHDPHHGRRAAEKLMSLQVSGLINLTGEEFSDLYRAISLHNLGYTEENMTVMTCWDADRLDLWRVGIKPDPKYLCTTAAKKMALEMEFA